MGGCPAIARILLTCFPTVTKQQLFSRCLFRGLCLATGVRATILFLKNNFEKYTYKVNSQIWKRNCAARVDLIGRWEGHFISCLCPSEGRNYVISCKAACAQETSELTVPDVCCREGSGYEALQFGRNTYLRWVCSLCLCLLYTHTIIQLWIVSFPRRCDVERTVFMDIPGSGDTFLYVRVSCISAIGDRSSVLFLEENGEIASEKPRHSAPTPVSSNRQMFWSKSAWDKSGECLFSFIIIFT
jgi:hypothetical protein